MDVFPYKRDAAVMDQYAIEIGRLCMAWADLETAIGILMVDLLEPAHVAAQMALMTNMDIRDRIATTLPLALVSKPDDRWFSVLQSCLNRINNDIRNERNRMVHDSWVQLRDRTMARFRPNASVIRPQSRTLSLTTGEIVPVAVAEIATLVQRVTAETDLLHGIWNFYQKHRSELRASPDKF